jgi:hypothetical protein
MGLKIFTWVHVVISLIAIVSGCVVVIGLLAAQPLDSWTIVFLVTTGLTSATGFGFPFKKFMPSHALSIISLAVLAVTILARYAFQLSGSWRWVYVIGAVISFYLNVFVLIVQAFQKVPALKAKAPTQSEPPFLATQLGTLAVFVAITIVAALRFYP